MLKLDLVALEKAGSFAVEASIPEDGAFWEQSRLTPTSALQVALKASVALSGEIIVRGALDVRLAQACRRCLKPIDVPERLDVTLVFTPPDELGGRSDARPVRVEDTELDLEGPLLEELVLGIAPYAVCSSDCRGLCPGCGAELNKETCQCASEARDPRWEALRVRKTD